MTSNLVHHALRWFSFCWPCKQTNKAVLICKTVTYTERNKHNRKPKMYKCVPCHFIQNVYRRASNFFLSRPKSVPCWGHAGRQLLPGRLWGVGTWNEIDWQQNEKSVYVNKSLQGGGHKHFGRPVIQLCYTLCSWTAGCNLLKGTIEQPSATKHASNAAKRHTEAVCLQKSWNCINTSTGFAQLRRG